MSKIAKVFGKIFGGGTPKQQALPPLPPLPTLEPLPPLPTKADPEIAEARKRQRLSAKLRKGRRRSILTSGSGVTDPLLVNRPEAREATLLGQ